MASKAALPTPENPAEDLVPPLDMDALLGLTQDESEIQEPIPAPVESALQKRIRELQAELDTPSPEAFRPTSELSEDEKMIRDLEDKVSRKRSAEAEAADPRYENPDGDGERILLHFLEDGFTFGGVVWYRGQEVEFVVGSKAHRQQIDRFGHSWLDTVGDTAAQYRRWNKQYFALGPWPGQAWGDTSRLSNPEEISQAEASAQAERRRGRAAPLSS